MKSIDIEQQNIRGSFDDENVRRGFIRKVYAILSVQLIITMGIVVGFVSSPEVQEFALTHSEVFYLCLIGTFVVMIILMCCSGLLREYPCNLFILAFFTLCSSILIGYAACSYKPDMILLAVCITAVVVICLTFFAIQTSIDFTVLGGVLCVALVLLIFVSAIGLFFPSKILQLIIAYSGALLFSFYLVYDTQMIIGGEHKFAFDPEDYVFAVFALYLDIINLFLYILELLGLIDK